MDLKVISELIKMVSDSKLTTLEVESKELRVRLEKNYNSAAQEAYHSQKELLTQRLFDKSEVQSELSLEKATSEASSVETVVRAADSKDDENLKVVKSPIVGTFYSAASPDSEAFATLGKKVKKGDTLCIIEAMKLMNEIESEFDGEVVEILIKNGEMVEYGQPLFKLK